MQIIADRYADTFGPLAIVSGRNTPTVWADTMVNRVRFDDGSLCVIDVEY